jgi:hypothetical protein
MVALVTLSEAKRHLGYSVSESDEDLDEAITLQMGAASDLVLDYITEGDDAWTAETVPSRVKSAILLVLGSLWRNRGDDEKAPNPITEAVDNLLYGLRDPSLA